MICAITAIVILILVLLTEPFHELTESVSNIGVVAAGILPLWWVIIGWGVYTGAEGLKVDEPETVNQPA